MTNTLIPTTKEELQTYVETQCQSLLPNALEKLRTAIDCASSPTEIIKVFTTIADYSQVTSATQNKSYQTGLQTGITLSGEVFGTAFGAMANAFGIEPNKQTLKDITPKGDINVNTEAEEIPEANEFQFD